MAFDLTKPVRLRDGRPVKILCTDLKADQPIAGRVMDEDGDRESVETWYENGHYLYNDRVSEMDLVNMPKRHVMYINFYGNDMFVSHSTKADAESNASDHRIACVRIEFEEGQFDE